MIHDNPGGGRHGCLLMPQPGEYLSQPAGLRSLAEFGKQKLQFCGVEVVVEI